MSCNPDNWNAEKTIHIDVQAGDSPTAQVPANTPTDIVYQHFIDGVYFDRTVMSPGGTCTLDVHTVFTGAGCPITVELKDENGTFDTIEAKMYDWQRSFEVHVPYEANGHVRATVTLDGGKEPVVSSGVVRLTDPVVVRELRWENASAGKRTGSDKPVPVRDGDVVRLTAQVSEAGDGHTAFVRIVETDALGDGLHMPVFESTQIVKNGGVELQWQVDSGKDRMDIPVQSDEAEYERPAYVAEVTVLSVTARSTTSPGRPAGRDPKRGQLLLTDDLTIQLVDAQTGAPFGDADVEVTLADGSEESLTLSADGSGTLDGVAPGPATIRVGALGELGEPSDKAADVNGARDAFADATDDGLYRAEIDTGRPWRIWVRSGSDSAFS